MLILKLFFKFILGLNIANKIKIMTKWKKNLPQITWFKGIIVPRYFAVESWQTKIKYPVIARNITLIKWISKSMGIETVFKRSSELNIDTTDISPEQAVQEVMLYLEQKGFVK